MGLGDQELHVLSSAEPARLPRTCFDLSIGNNIARSASDFLVRKVLLIKVVLSWLDPHNE